MFKLKNNMFKLILLLVCLNKIVYSFKLTDQEVLRNLFDLYEKEFIEDENNEYRESGSVEDDSDVDQQLVKFTRKLTGSTRNDLSGIGQVGGLAVESNGNLVIFHRASRKWEYDSFLPGNKFNTKKYDAIKEDCIEHINLKEMKSVKSWGSNTFYMPHGLTVDKDQNVWLTDVALHQVFKYDANGNFEKPSLVLGVQFENGDDDKHFCKPTDVAIASNGDIYVSDGYCNSRVVKFDRNGQYVKEYKMKKDQLDIPHSVALIESQNLICVADRENGRIVCFDIDTGNVKHILDNEHMKKVYAIEYSEKEELLHAVSGSAGYRDYPYGFTFDAAKGSVFGNLLSVWEPSNYHFKDPHDITVTPDGQKVYVGELDGDIEEFQLNYQETDEQALQPKQMF